MLGCMDGRRSPWECVVLCGLLLQCSVVRRSLSCAQLVSRCLAMPLRSLAGGFFSLQYLLWCYLLCDVVCDASVFYCSVIGGDAVCSGTAPSQSCSGWVASQNFLCSDRILTCRIKRIRSPAKVGLVVTDLITSPVVSWEGWETPPPAPRLSCPFFAQPPAW